MLVSSGKCRLREEDIHKPHFTISEELYTPFWEMVRRITQVLEKQHMLGKCIQMSFFPSKYVYDYFSTATFRMQHAEYSMQNAACRMHRVSTIHVK